MTYPILEFDPSPEALIEPSKWLPQVDGAESCVLCFFREVVDKVAAEHKAEIVGHITCEFFELPIYQIEYQGKKVAFILAGLGAPLSAGILEDIIAHGYHKIVACGGAGVLNKEIQVGKIIIPSSAVRDEGTSYHYAAPSREIELPQEQIDILARELDRQQVPYIIGKTWTTDAFYRETKDRIARRKSEGCLTVEMECAALAAVSQFRQVKFAQYLYGGDDVSGQEWDPRGWEKAAVRENLFWAAVNASLHL
jgi:uridine phosphorylase